MRTLPTLLQLYTNVRSDVDAEFGVNISTKKKVGLRVKAAVHAGKLWLLYKYLGFVQKQIWPDTADSEFMGGTLERFGRVKLGRNPDQAIAGEYTVEVTGTIGAVIPAEQTWKSDDTSLNPGFIFELVGGAYALVSNPDTITIKALTPGVDAELNIGDTLTVTSPIANVNKTAEVTANTVLPLAAEDLEDYRAKVVEAFRMPSNGGSAGDYRLWSQDAQGVIRVYPYAKTAETNAMNVFVEATEADSTDGKGTPPALMITDVQNVINFNPDTSLLPYQRSRKPATVILYVLPVTIITVDIVINGFAGVTAAQQALILQALTAAIADIRPHVDAADVEANRNDVLDTQRVAGIIYAAIPGANYTGVTVKFNTVALQTFHFTQGNIPFLNTVTYL